MKEIFHKSKIYHIITRYLQPLRCVDWNTQHDKNILRVLINFYMIDSFIHSDFIIILD